MPKNKNSRVDENTMIRNRCNYLVILSLTLNWEEKKKKQKQTNKYDTHGKTKQANTQSFALLADDREVILNNVLKGED